MNVRVFTSNNISIIYTDTQFSNSSSIFFNQSWWCTETETLHTLHVCDMTVCSPYNGIGVSQVKPLTNSLVISDFSCGSYEERTLNKHIMAYNFFRKLKQWYHWDYLHYIHWYWHWHCQWLIYPAMMLDQYLRNIS